MVFDQIRRRLRNDASPSPGMNGAAPAQCLPPGIEAVDPALQRRFARGIQYNMKILIKGDRNVGKSSLLYRLSGGRMSEEYEPTDEIQVRSIQWSYRATDDIVKVDVWDVVDKANKKRKPAAGLKLKGDVALEFDDVGLDAETVNVYKGAHGVIMLFDITKPWTFDYAQREIGAVPLHIPILILANHRDMGHHRQVTYEQAAHFVETLDRGSPTAAQVRYAESSMRNGFGLKFVYLFFNLPFLTLQREALLGQLDRNAREIELTYEELDMHAESEEFNYDVFIDRLTVNRRDNAVALAPPSTVPGVAGAGSQAIPAQTQFHAPASRPPPIPGQVTSESRHASQSSPLPPHPAPMVRELSPQSVPATLTRAATAVSPVQNNLPALDTSPMHVDASLDDFLNSPTSPTAQYSFPKNALPQVSAVPDSSDDEPDNCNSMVANTYEDIDSDEAAPPAPVRPTLSQPDSLRVVGSVKQSPQTLVSPQAGSDEDSNLPDILNAVQSPDFDPGNPVLLFNPVAVALDTDDTRPPSSTATSEAGSSTKKKAKKKKKESSGSRSGKEGTTERKSKSTRSALDDFLNDSTGAVPVDSEHYEEL